MLISLPSLWQADHSILTRLGVAMSLLSMLALLIFSTARLVLSPLLQRTMAS
jgi:hypothetical protein